MKTFLQKEKIKHLKEKNKRLVNLINEILTEIKTEEIKGQPFEVESVLKRIQKRRKQEIEGWNKAKETREINPEIIPNLEKDIEYLQNLLPKEISGKNLEKLIQEVKATYPDFKSQLTHLKTIKGVNIGEAVTLLKK